MNLEKEIKQIFKESYLEHFFQFLKEDKEYLALSGNIILKKQEILKIQLKKLKKI